jgi:hypothetical protein
VDGSRLLLQAGQGAYSFSFHTSRFTTGRDPPAQGQVHHFGAWSTRLDEVSGSDISRLTVTLRQPASPILVWDGERMVALP